MKNEIKNDKIKKIFFCFFLGLFFFFSISFGGKNVLAAGSATVSWVAPTIDEGGGALTGLTGYRVYYDTSPNWASSCPLDAGEYKNITGGSTQSYFFNDNLTPGSTYYFTVVAYDDSSNMSGCAQSSGGATQVSKLITYSGDLDGDHDVDLFDYNILHTNYGSSGPVGDIDKNGLVEIFDYNILKEDYGSSF